MPLFFFHLAGPSEFSSDNDGVDFKNLDDAYLDVHRAALEISFDMIRARRDPSHHRFEVCDASGRLVLILPFAEVLHQVTSSAAPGAGLVHQLLESRIQRGRELKIAIAAQLSQALATTEQVRATIESAGLRKN